MGRFFKMFTIIMIVLVVCMGLVFAGDSTAVVNGSFNLTAMLKNIDYKDILKWVGIILGAISGGGVTFVTILFAILRGIPNNTVDKWGDGFGVFLTKVGRQKLSEQNVDTAETTYIRFQRAVEGAMRRLNPDLPKADNK